MKKSLGFLSGCIVEGSFKNKTYTIESYLSHLFDAAFYNDIEFIMKNCHESSSWNIRCPDHACQFLFLSMLFSLVREHKALLNPWLELYFNSDHYCKIISLYKVDPLEMSDKLKLLIHWFYGTDNLHLYFKEEYKKDIAFGYQIYIEKSILVFESLLITQ